MSTVDQILDDFVGRITKAYAVDLTFPLLDRSHHLSGGGKDGMEGIAD